MTRVTRYSNVPVYHTTRAGRRDLHRAFISMMKSAGECMKNGGHVSMTEYRRGGQAVAACVLYWGEVPNANTKRR